MKGLLPYPGLRAFERHESRIFFGRQQQIDDLLIRLKKHKFLAVLGASGSGKSSLIKAGLLAGLEKGYMGEVGCSWSIAEMRPGNRPFARLAEALLEDETFRNAWLAVKLPTDAQNPPAIAGQPVNQPAFLSAELQRGSRSLQEILQLARLPQGRRLLLLVDQFEEIFRYQEQQDNQAAAFVTLLLEACRDDAIYVVITMRSDFLGNTARFHGLPEAINDGLYLTPRLTRQQLTKAIQLPARLFATSVEDALVNHLLNEAGNDPDQLPLLQHALMRLFSGESGDNAGNTDKKHITLDQYRQLKGLRGALDDHAEQAWDELNSAQQAIAKSLFTALTERSRDGQDIRRLARVAGLLELTQTDLKTLREIVNTFRQSGRNFLMPPPTVDLQADSVLDISHESLIRQWRRLQGWVNEESDKAAMYQRLWEAAQRHAEQQGELWHGTDLALAIEWRTITKPDAHWAKRYESPDSIEIEGENKAFERVMAFLDASEAEAQRQKDELESGRRQELRQVRRQMVFAVVGLLIAAALALWGSIERQHAEENSARAEATEINRTRSLFDSTLTHASLLTKVEDYAKARKLLADSRQWDKDVPAPRRHARDLLTGFVTIMGGEAEFTYQGAGTQLTGNVAISPDGHWLAASGERGTLVLFDHETARLVHRLEGHNTKSRASEATVFDIAFHPKKNWLYSAGVDGQIIRWRLPQEGQPASIAQQWQVGNTQVWALAISAGGKILVSGHTDGSIHLWEADDGKKIRKLEGHTRTIAERGLSFSPDGKQLASASYDNTVRLWDVSSIVGWVERSETQKANTQKTDTQKKDKQIPTKISVTTLYGHTDRVQGIAYNPDGKWLASAGKDQSIILWDPKTGKQLGSPLKGHKNMVFDLQFIPRPTTEINPQIQSWLLASASHDNTIRLWDVDTGITIRSLQGHTAGVLSLALWQNQYLYSTSNDGTAKRWPIQPSQQWLLDLQSELKSTAIAPNGKTITVGLANGTLKILTVGRVSDSVTRHDKLESSTNPDPKPELTIIDEIKDAHKSGIKRLAYNPKGTMLASAGMDSITKLWSITPEGKLKPHKTFDDHTDVVHAVTFSPDGSQLATASYDGQVGLTAVDGDELSLFKAHDGRVASVNFNSNGTQLLSSGNNDFKLKLWNLTTQAPSLINPVYQAQDSLLWSSLSPDGQWIASVGRETVITLYPVNGNTKPLRFQGHESTVYKVIFSPDSRQLATVSADMTVRFWDLDTQNELFRLRLPSQRKSGPPLWDFDFRCTPTGCWIVAPLTSGKLAVYNLGKIGYD